MRRALVACAFLTCLPAYAGLDVPPPQIDTSQFATQSQLSAAQAADVAAAIASAPVQSVNGKTGVITTATLPGLFTVQSATNPLPAASSNQGRYANVSDLAGVASGGGNGTGLVYSNGTCWSRFRTQVTPQPVAVAATVNVSALTMSSLIQLTGSGLASSATINVTGACQGDIFHVLFPAGLIGALGSLGISINTSPSLTVPGLAGAVSGTWGEYSLNGTTVVKIGGGSL